MSDKISSIENSLIELNRMFEVSAIASNAISIEDLVSKLSDFLSDYLNSDNIYFFALEKNLFKNIPTNQVPFADKYFEYENEAFWSVISYDKIIKIENEENKKLYGSFWEQNGLNDLNVQYMRVFFNRNDNMPVCFCFLGNNDKESEDRIANTLKFLNRVFEYIEPMLIKLMGAEGDFARLAVQYIRVYAICSPLTTIVFAMDNLLRICGFIRGSMFLNILMSVLSGVLEFLFLGVFGFGVWGAAFATCSGMMVCALLALTPFIRGKALLRFVRPRFHARMIRQIISCGSPNFLNNIAGRITSILLNAILVRIGGELAVSIYGVLMYTEGFIQPLLYGMCDSLQPAVGYNLGAGKLSRVRAIERCCFTASAVVSLLSVAIMLLIPETISQLFMPDADAEGLAMTVTALRFFALTYVTRWFSFATQSFMLAIERPREAAFISVSTALVFPVLLILLLWPLGLTGIWLNFAGTSMLAGILAAAILLRLRTELIKADT